MHMLDTTVLLLPGWQNSDPDHWQSHWERLYGDLRVDQHEWMVPLRGDWVARLEEVVLGLNKPCVLAAHSLGCLLVAAWAAHSANTQKVRGALLVAPPDPAQPVLQSALHRWSPPVMRRLPFRSVLLASSNDPYCALPQARAYAHAWGAEFVDYGARGHINSASALGDWPEGRDHLARLMAEPAGAGNNEKEHHG